MIPTRGIPAALNFLRIMELGEEAWVVTRYASKQEVFGDISESWLERVTARYKNNQIVLVDMLTPVYVSMMQLFNPQVRSVFIVLAGYYHVGATIKNLALYTRLDNNIVSSVISRLKKANLVEITDGRRYRITVENFLRVYAIRWGSLNRFDSWRGANPDVDGISIIDAFIKDQDDLILSSS